MAQTSFARRRVNPRRSFFADAEVILPSKRVVRAQLSELSSKGCYIDTLELIPVGTDLKVGIWHGVRHCELNGKVIYVHSGGGMGIFGMGVVFGDINSEQQSVIDAWVAGLHPAETAEHRP